MCPDRISAVRERLAALEMIVAVAAEHAEELDARRLIRLVELYAQLLEDEGEAAIGFDEFVHDAAALGRAAARSGGASASVPAPLSRRDERGPSDG